MSCDHNGCALDSERFEALVIRWIESLPVKLNEERMVLRCDVALCFKDRPLAVKFFETRAMTRRVCEEMQAAGGEFRRRWADYRGEMQ